MAYEFTDKAKKKPFIARLRDKDKNKSIEVVIGRDEAEIKPKPPSRAGRKVTKPTITQAKKLIEAGYQDYIVLIDKKKTPPGD